MQHIAYKYYDNIAMNGRKKTLLGDRKSTFKSLHRMDWGNHTDLESHKTWVPVSLTTKRVPLLWYLNEKFYKDFYKDFYKNATVSKIAFKFNLLMFNYYPETSTLIAN